MIISRQTISNQNKPYFHMLYCGRVNSLVTTHIIKHLLLIAYLILLFCVIIIIHAFNFTIIQFFLESALQLKVIKKYTKK